MNLHSDHPPFAYRLLAWWDDHGRKSLPWQRDRSAYRVWVSEVMLQQTQVSTVVPYFERFVERFPDVVTLANAADDDVLHLWTGLGYYARARNLLKAARTVRDQFNGEFPDTAEQLERLPGIGRSTANAIHALSRNERAAILDGNVKRVLTRWAGIDGWPGLAAVDAQLWALAESLLPEHRHADYTQAQMDLGATVCTRSRPACERCPLAIDCTAVQAQRTHELPARRPAKPSPERECLLWIFTDDVGQVLLEQRPPRGIWGGLWSFPESTPRAGLSDVAERVGVVPGTTAAVELGPFVHVFSHFRLRIRPQWVSGCRASPNANAVAEPNLSAAATGGTLWYRHGYHRLGLAAPVQRLLDTLTGGATHAEEPEQP